MKKDKKKGLGKKIFLCVLVCLLAAVAAVAVWQRNNIVAVVKMMSHSGDEIAQEMNTNKKKLEDDLKEKNPSIVSDFTAEQEKEIIKGTLSVDDAVKDLNERYEGALKEYSLKSTGNSETDKKADKLVSDKVIELYSLKAYYLGQLGQLEARVKSEYFALPASKRNLVGKKEIVSKNMGTAMNLLSSCDSKVSSLLGELRSQLKSLGADTSVIKTIESAYENEKALKKAYYLKLMGE